MLFEPTDPNFLSLVRCPVTGSQLSPVNDQVVQQFNQQVEDGNVFNCVGQRISDTVQSLLINEDRTMLVLIREGIVTLIADELIPVTGLRIRRT